MQYDIMPSHCFMTHQRNPYEPQSCSRVEYLALSMRAWKLRTNKAYCSEKAEMKVAHCNSAVRSKVGGKNAALHAPPGRRESAQLNHLKSITQWQNTPTGDILQIKANERAVRRPRSHRHSSVQKQGRLNYCTVMAKQHCRQTTVANKHSLILQSHSANTSLIKLTSLSYRLTLDS